MNNFLDISKQKQTEQHLHRKKNRTGFPNDGTGGYVLQNQPSEIQEVSSYQEDDNLSHFKGSNLIGNNHNSNDVPMRHQSMNLQEDKAMLTKLKPSATALLHTPSPKHDGSFVHGVPSE